MDIGTTVRVKGTQLVGEIISKDHRRVQSSTAKIFFIVQFPDGSTMEYGIEELRTVE